MQIFIISDPLETGKILDPRRLRKQIIETDQIIKAITGQSKGWANHPIVHMYREHVGWLHLYRDVLICVRDGNYEEAERINKESEKSRPSFLIPEYLENMKKRLYTKDPDYYSVWTKLGPSYVNMYFVDNCWRYYEQKN